MEVQRPRDDDIPFIAFADASLTLTPAPSANQLLPVSPLSLSLSNSAEDQATCFFFQNYVLGGNDMAKGNLDYLSELYGSEEIGSGLADSVAALGMVGLANFWKAPSIMSNAAFKYNSAMRTISSQLRDVEEAKSDQNMVSILLMGLYEVFSI